MIYAGATVSNLTVSSGGIEVFVSSGVSTTATVATAVATQTASVQTNAAQSTAVDTSATTTVGAFAASPGPAMVESTVANLIQALAGITAREGGGALFESASSGWLHEHAGTLVPPHQNVPRN